MPNFETSDLIILSLCAWCSQVVVPKSICLSVWRPCGLDEDGFLKVDTDRNEGKLL